MRSFTCFFGGADAVENDWRAGRWCARGGFVFGSAVKEEKSWLLAWAWKLLQVVLTDLLCRFQAPAPLLRIHDALHRLFIGTKIG